MLTRSYINNLYNTHYANVPLDSNYTREETLFCIFFFFFLICTKSNRRYAKIMRNKRKIVHNIIESRCRLCAMINV